MKFLAAAAMVVLYLAVSHVAVVNGYRPVALAASAIVLAIALWPMRRYRTAVAIGATLVVALIGTAVLLGRTRDLIYATPVLIGLLLLAVFGWTLLPGKVPLLTRFATMVRGPLEPRIARYTRAVTALWTGYFALLVAETVLLAAFAPVEVWSLFANGINYAVMAVLFLGEYAYRRYRFSDLEHPGLTRYIQLIRESGYRPAPAPSGTMRAADRAGDTPADPRVS